MELFVGLDLGQAQDYTALAVVERTCAPKPGTRRGIESQYKVRQLDRAPLGIRYTEVVEQVKALLAIPPLSPTTPLIVDKTGVGAAVLDMFTVAGLRPHAVTIHGGDNTIRDGPRHWKVPKRELAGLLVSLYQGRRLQVAEGLAHAATLTREVANFRVKIDLRTGHDSYEAWREHDHDDLVLAVALACWYGEQQASKGLQGRAGAVSGPRVSARPAASCGTADDVQRYWERLRGPAPERRLL